MLHGYDDLQQQFSFQNSRGVNWGDSGHGYIPYTVFETTWVEGWVTALAAKPMDENPKGGVAERRWGVYEHGSGILHCYEFVDSKAGKIGWTFFVERDGFVEVEELFVMPAFRKRGYATELVRLIRDYARERNTSLKAWINGMEGLATRFNLVTLLDIDGTSLRSAEQHLGQAHIALLFFLPEQTKRFLESG